MSVPRIFIDAELKEGEIEIPEEELNHLKVRRVGREKILIVNGRGLEAEAVFDPKKRSAMIREVREILNRELSVRISLFQAALKWEKMDWLVQKTTELGVHRIVVMQTSRTVVKPNKNKLKRWQKIAKEALKQCGRGILPEVGPWISLNEARPAGSVLFLWEKSKRKLSEALKEILNRRPNELSIFIGPEGGFSDEEAEHILSLNAVEASLGDVILRSETASVYILSILNFVLRENWRL